MANSHRAKKSLSKKHNVVVVHWLMNRARKVIISSKCNQNEIKTATKHFKDIGLNPKIMEPAKHDLLIGALLTKEVLPKLQEMRAEGDLTPSGQELLRLLKVRQKKWTQTTQNSLLDNPQLNKTLNQLMKGRI
jgi:hypothetical protein